jgi:uracil-DNA glycosylase
LTGARPGGQLEFDRLSPGEPASEEPSRDCPRCPRLVDFRLVQRRDHADWHNAPVPSFGLLSARLLVVGLAPGLKGANRTGRPFTGDYAGELLYPTLIRHGFASGEYRASPDDGTVLRDCRITNTVRCVPPENKPETSEIASCRSFLAAEIASMPRLRAILALGAVAHAGILTALGEKRSGYPFKHGAFYRLADGTALGDSYHCSRYNTSTGKLTAEMFDQVVAGLRHFLEEGLDRG